MHITEDFLPNLIKLIKKKKIKYYSFNKKNDVGKHPFCL